MIKKKCSKCNRSKGLHLFAIDQRREHSRASWCKSCYNKRSSEIRKRNFEWIFDYLAIHHCVDCKEDDPIVLDFDHVRGKKKERISQLVTQNYSLNVIKKEVAKCEVRCANCHRRKTAKQCGWHAVMDS